MKALPEGVEIDLSYYFISPSKGVNVVVVLKGFQWLPDFDNDPALAVKVQQTRLPDHLADDWRLMTAQEVRSHKAEEYLNRG